MSDEIQNEFNRNVAESIGHIRRQRDDLRSKLKDMEEHASAASFSLSESMKEVRELKEKLLQAEALIESNKRGDEMLLELVSQRGFVEGTLSEAITAMADRLEAAERSNAAMMECLQYLRPHFNDRAGDVIKRISEALATAPLSQWVRKSDLVPTIQLLEMIVNWNGDNLMRFPELETELARLKTLRGAA